VYSFFDLSKKLYTPLQSFGTQQRALSPLCKGWVGQVKSVEGAQPVRSARGRSSLAPLLRGV
jgi:hypothetical protein